MMNRLILFCIIAFLLGNNLSPAPPINYSYMGVALPLSGKLLIAMAVLAEEMLTSRLHSETESCDDEDDVPLTQPVEKPLAGNIVYNVTDIHCIPGYLLYYRCNGVC